MITGANRPELRALYMALWIAKDQSGAHLNAQAPCTVDGGVGYPEHASRRSSRVECVIAIFARKATEVHGQCRLPPLRKTYLSAGE